MSRQLGNYAEGISQAQEGSETHERLGRVVDQAHTLQSLALLFNSTHQFDAAEGAMTQVVGLFADKPEPFLFCQSCNILGCIYHTKARWENPRSPRGSPRDRTQVRPARFALWGLSLPGNAFFDQRVFDGAQAQIDLAKSHAVNHTYIHVQHDPCDVPPGQDSGRTGQTSRSLAGTLCAGEVLRASVIGFRGRVEGSPGLSETQRKAPLPSVSWTSVMGLWQLRCFSCSSNLPQLWR